jgi:predicted  nucleic acid-binding Zn ribbon protein
MRAPAAYLGLFATTLSFILAASPKQFAPASSIGVSAKEIGSARNIVTRWQTSWGSCDRDYLATRDVEIEVHNLSQLPARIAIDFYIVGRPQRVADAA